MGVADITIHDLRRTLASYMAIDRASLPIIGRALNHKSQSSTEIYARLSQDPVHTAVNKAGSRMMQSICKPMQLRHDFNIISVRIQIGSLKATAL